MISCKLSKISRLTSGDLPRLKGQICQLQPQEWAPDPWWLIKWMINGDWNENDEWWNDDEWLLKLIWNVCFEKQAYQNFMIGLQWEGHDLHMVIDVRNPVTTYCFTRWSHYMLWISISRLDIFSPHYCHWETFWRRVDLTWPGNLTWHDRDWKFTEKNEKNNETFFPNTAARSTIVFWPSWKKDSTGKNTSTRVRVEVPCSHASLASSLILILGNVDVGASLSPT